MKQQTNVTTTLALNPSLAATRKDVGFALAARKYEFQDWGLIALHPEQTDAVCALETSSDPRNLVVMPAEVYFAQNGNVRLWNVLGEPVAVREARPVPAYEWKKEDSGAAEAQGWNLFESHGDTVELQLQRVDEAEVFGDDCAAAKHVQQLADSGDQVAVRAIRALVATGSSDVARFGLTLPEAQVVTLPDGFNGHTLKFFVEPIEVLGDTVKLRCAEPGKGYLFTWREKSVVDAAAASQSVKGSGPVVNARAVAEEAVQKTGL